MCWLKGSFSLEVPPSSLVRRQSSNLFLILFVRICSILTTFQLSHRTHETLATSHLPWYVLVSFPFLSSPLGEQFSMPMTKLQIGGQVRLHGLPGGPDTPSWVRLNRTAQKGDTKIRVNSDVAGKWPVGGKIVLASSDFDRNQAETFTIVEGNLDTRSQSGFCNVICLPPPTDSFCSQQPVVDRRIDDYSG